MTQAFYKRRRIQASKPNINIPIDWSGYPTLAAVVLTDSSGTNVYGRRGLLSISATGVSAATQFGIGRYVSGSSKIHVSNELANSVNKSTLVAVGIGSGSGGMIMSLGQAKHCIGSVYGAFFGGADGSARIANGDADTVGVPFVMASIYDGTNCTLISRKSVATGVGSYSGSTGGLIIYNRDDSAQAFTGTLVLGLVLFDTGLSLARSLVNNPWQIFRAPDSRIWIPADGGGSTDSLTASSIVGSSVVGSPAITQSHTLTASTVEASSAVAAPAVTQQHALSAQSIALESATVASPAITQSHTLTASQVSIAPTVGLPTLTEIVAGILSALPITVSATVGAPALTQTHALTAGATAAGPATFGTPTLAQQHVLMAQDITAGSLVGAPALSPGGAYSGSISDEDIARIAAAVLAALQATNIPVNTVQINSKPLAGSGTPADPMRPA